MKKTFLALGFICIAATACNKTTTTPQPTQTPTTTTPTNNTNDVNGDWKLSMYDGLAVSAPMAGSYKATATSATAGTAKFDITFDGSSHMTEDVSYTLSNNNKNIVFTKTGGNYNVLSGGGTWTIDTLNSNNLSMKSAMGLIIKMTK